MTAEDRDTLAVILTDALDRPLNETAVSEVMWACRDFLEHDNPALLIADLRKTLTD
jgi:hypothetical protein